MTLVRMNALDLGGGYDVQLDAGSKNDLVMRASENGNLVSRLADDGVRTTIAPNYTLGTYAYGGIQNLTGGGFVVYGTIHAGLGRGVTLQIYSAKGALVGSDIQPMAEQNDDPLSGTGYSVTPTANGGFAVVYSSDANASTQIPIDYTQNGAAQTYQLYAASDVRIHYYSATGVSLAGSTIGSTDTVTVNGATTTHQADNQYIWDTDTLKSGKVAYAYYDRAQVGQDSSVGGGFHAQETLTVEVSTGPGASGTPIKVDQIPWYTGNGGGNPGVNTLETGAAANVVALPGGGFAVVWSERSYGGDGNGFDGWDAKIRYFDSAGKPTTDALTFLVRGTAMGNETKYIWAEALPDGRIAVAWQDGSDGANGSGAEDAYVGVLTKHGATFAEHQRINPDPAAAGQVFSIYDLAVRADGTFDVAYNDARLRPDGSGYTLGHTVIERFSLGKGVTGETFGGSATADSHTGGAGNDLITGWDGNDSLNGVGGADRIEGGRGNDTLDGGAGIDLLAGGEGDDTLIGGAGADRLVGGNGSDTASYANSAASVMVNLSKHSGTSGDAMGDTFNGVENVTGTAFADILIGDGGANILTGGAGSDRIHGRGGADTLVGGRGNDLYWVDTEGDTIIEQGGQGKDLAYVSVNNHVMEANLETLILTGSAYLAYGNDTANIMRGKGTGYHELYGRGGNDQLYGGTGGDTLIGGAGNDTYYINDANDHANEQSDEGIDTVIATVTFELGYNVDNLRLAGQAAIDGKGNTLDNRLNGNSAANKLEGLQGSDRIDGHAGNDILVGGSGDDRLTGGGGADAFRFAGYSAADGGIDTIMDFVHAVDHIEMERYYFGAIPNGGALDPAAFIKGTDAQTADQHIIYTKATGMLYYDADGSGAGAKIAIAHLEGNPTLSAADIVLI